MALTTARKKYPINTLGLTAEVFVLPIIAYTNDATLALFIANAVEGEMGIYLNDTNKTLVSAALTAGQEYLIAQKRDGLVHLSQPITYRLADVTSCAFVNNVLQVDTVVVASPATVRGQVFQVKIMDTTFSSDSFPFWTLTFTSVTGAETVAQIRDGLLADYTRQQGAPFTGRPWDVVVATSGASSLTITAKFEETSFKTIIREQLALNGSVSTTTAWVKGSGEGYQVQWMEEQGNILEGLTGYDVERFDNMGSTVRFAKEACTYDLKIINEVNKFVSHGAQEPFNEHPYNVYLPIETTVVGVTGSALFTTLTTILGV
jgi:hypothetical protein